MRFAKYQALGNDYIVIREADLTAPLRAEQVRRMTDRHRGVGSDGVLLAGARDASGAFGLRILNPDGSEAEKSGNGLRIYARFLWDEGAVRAEPFPVTVPGGRVQCRVTENGRSVQVEMGRVSFQSRAIPMTGPPREVLRESLELDGELLVFSGATIGNPHCVLVDGPTGEARARALGPRLECHPLFPNRTNVQLAEVLAPERIRIWIWERGAGYTLASGSSASAAAAVCRRLDLCAAAVSVEMPGGELEIEIAPDFAIRMTGPVAPVHAGVLSAEALA